VPHERAPGLPEQEIFGRVTYCVPHWAFADRFGNPRDQAQVCWPGRAVFKSSPYTTIAIEHELPVDGDSTHEPGDAFCELSVCGEDDGLMCQGPVITFGRLITRLAPEGATVAPGDSLFVFEARPPTTAEWWELRGIRPPTRTRSDRRPVGPPQGPVAATRWKLSDWWEQRSARRRRRREGRQALKEWKAEQAAQRKSRSS
jgi:hypothetical protein